MALTELTETTIKQALAEHESVIIDFWAPWCGPCRAITPLLEQLSSEHGERIAFYKVNIDQEPMLAARFKVMSIPTVIRFDAGAPSAIVVGALPKSRLERDLRLV